MNKRITFLTFALLTLSALCIFPTNLYLPIMPQIQKHFGMSQGMIQASITVFLIAESISPLFIGTALERWGRKNTLLVLCAGFIASSLMCMWAPTTTWLLVGRALQGATLSGVKTGKRALYRDFFSGHALAKLVSYTLPIVSITLALSPIIGGYSQTFLGWQSYFYLAALVYALILTFIFYGLPKQTPTNPNASMQSAFEAYKKLLKDPTFMRWTTCSGLSLGYVIAYQTSSPLIYQNILGLSPIHHGWISGLTIFSMLIGSFITHRFYQAKTPKRLTAYASFCLILSALGTMLAMLLDLHSPWSLMLPYLIGLTGVTITFACAFSEAMTPWGNISSFAAALYNTHKHVVAAIASTTLMLTPESSMWPLATLWLVIGFLQWGCLRASNKI